MLSTKLTQLLTGFAVSIPISAGAALASVSINEVVPANRVIQPLGYGVVRQTLVTSSSRTGSAWCAAYWGTQFQCVSVSGANSCAALAPAGEVVSCNAVGTPPVDESAFQPVSCNGQATGPLGPLGADDWCAIAGIESSRQKDTIYLFSDWVRLGLNRRFGGTVFELYGTDKADRIMQNGGGALQLSLWGDTNTYAPPSLPRAYFQVSKTQSCNPQPFSTSSECQAAGAICKIGVIGPNTSNCSTQMACGDNGATAGSPVNPLQAISAGCNYGQTAYSHDEAFVSSVSSSQPNVINLTKYGPEQFTKSNNQNLTGLTISQTSHLAGPFALMSYHITYNGMISWAPDYQEIPALFTHQGFSTGSVYYYTGSAPYQNSASPVINAIRSSGDTEIQVYQLPGRSGPFGVGIPTGHGAILTEDWVSLCDGSGSNCITIASFSPDAQDVIYGPNDASYFGIHGFFGIAPGFNKTINIWVAPYRWDDVVNGATVREWIYQLHGPSAQSNTSALVARASSAYIPLSQRLDYGPGGVLRRR